MMKTIIKLSWKVLKFSMECIIVYNILEVLTNSKEIYENNNKYKLNSDVGSDF